MIRGDTRLPCSCDSFACPLLNSWLPDAQTESKQPFPLLVGFPISHFSMLLFFLTKKVAQKSQGCAMALPTQPVKLFMPGS
jgi:hypothetical protein